MIENILNQCSRINFIRVSSITIRFEGSELIRPMTYLQKDIDDNVNIICKTRNEITNKISDLQNAEFVCQEITNFLGVPERYAVKLFSLI